MDMRSRLKFRKGDLLAIALVVLLAAGAFAVTWRQAAGEGTGVLQVYRDGALVKEADLSVDQQFDISGDYTNTVSIAEGRASITFSDCPGSDCVHSGWIDAPGRSIVCLPNRVELRITGQSEVDFTVR